MADIMFVPDYAYDHRYIVARECDNDWWFWGAYDDQFKATIAAEQIGGVVYDRAQD
jgi:hypothetical protein